MSYPYIVMFYPYIVMYYPYIVMIFCVNIFLILFKSRSLI